MKRIIKISFLFLMLLAVLGCQNSSKIDITVVGKNIKNIPPFSIDTLQHRTFNYFWDLGDNVHYQIPDRYPKKTFYSIAATGFGLVGYLIGIERDYITRDQGRERVFNTLIELEGLKQSSHETNSAGYKGFFYHFLRMDNANRYKKVELSSVDTGLLMAGVLAALTYFDQDNDKEKEIRNLAEKLYKEVQWDWMMADDGRMSMGWHPEKGFIPHHWKGYNEAMFLYIMAMASPTHPIPSDSWNKWTSTYEWEEYLGYEMLNFSPLFGHQFSHAFIDFRGIKDEYMQEKGIDYFENSKRATLANRSYCIKNPKKYTGYSEKVWGLSASDGPKDKTIEADGIKRQFRTYGARGVSSIHVFDDGTIAPYASGSSLPFTPKESMESMQYMWNTYGEKLIGNYGFKDAFNLSYTYGKGNEEGWFDPDYIGIDQGILLLMIENHRSEFIWKLMKKNPYIKEGLKKAGFK